MMDSEEHFRETMNDPVVQERQRRVRHADVIAYEWRNNEAIQIIRERARAHGEEYLQMLADADPLDTRRIMELQIVIRATRLFENLPELILADGEDAHQQQRAEESHQ